MAYAIRLRLSTPNAPEQAQKQWDNWRTDWQEVLPDQRTEYRTVPASDISDRPDDNDGCGDWTLEYTRGNPPEELL